MANKAELKGAATRFMLGGSFWMRGLRVNYRGHYVPDPSQDANFGGGGGYLKRDGEIAQLFLSNREVARYRYNEPHPELRKGESLAQFQMNARAAAAATSTEICLAGRTTPATRELLNHLPGVNLTIKKGVVSLNGVPVTDLWAWHPLHGGYGPQPD
jgi:hypothetical protein